jgi:hypothetical protein
MALYPEGTAPQVLDDVQRAANKANEIARQALGQNGAVVLSGSANVSGINFVAIQFLSSTTVTVLTAPSITGVGSLLTTIPAGVTIYGNFTAITITSGLLIAYKA